MDPAFVNILLWIMQGYLAISFLISGSAKFFQSPEKVAQLVPAAYPLPFLRTLGALEILGAIGVTLPLLINVFPVLTPISSSCMVIVLLAASTVHFKAKNYTKLPMILILLTVAVAVTVGRF